MKQWKLMIALLMTALCLMACAAAEDGPVEYTSGDFKYVLLEDGTAEITKYTGTAETLTVPDELDGHQVTGIRISAFAFYESLTSITLPDSLMQIGVNPFFFCGNLSDIRVSPAHPTLAIIDGVLFDKTEKKLICYPHAFSATSYAVPEGTLSIGNGAFSFCDALTGITLPDSLTSIGDSAFFLCTSLTSITLPEGVTSIGDSAFRYCDALTGITLPDSLTSIGDWAFAYCESLTSITLPDNLTSIGNSAFRNCPNNMLFTVPQGSYAEQWCRDNDRKFTYSNAND